jgi:hypothetical protein
MGRRKPACIGHLRFVHVLAGSRFFALSRFYLQYLDLPFLASMNNNNSVMSSWIESPHYDSHLNVPYLYPMDHPETSMRGADHPSSLYTGHSSYTPRHSPNSTRPTYNAGFYGPRPQPGLPEPIQGLPISAMPAPAMTEVEEADDEYMEVEPVTDVDGPMFPSEFDDEATRSQGKRRFVGGFIRGLKNIPRVVRRGWKSERRELMTPPGLSYHQSPYRSPYMFDPQPQEPEEAPPYDAPSEPVDSESRYMDTINMPAEFQSSDSPSRTPSHAIRAPRSESQLTYQSVINPPARHVSQHGSLHHTQRSSPPRTVRNPDPPSSPTDESGTALGNSRPLSQHPPLQPPPELGEPESASRTPPHLSPLEPTRRPTVTVQSPTGSPFYFEPQHSEDYAAMDMDLESPLRGTSEHSAPVSQFARIAKLFRDLNDLPWVAPNVTVNFDPTEAERARSAHARGLGKSWYTGHLDDLDILGGGGGSGGGSSTRGLAAPSGHSFGRAPGSSTTLAPPHGSASVSSSEGASANHLPSAPAPHVYPYPVHPLALPPQPFYLYPYPALQAQLLKPQQPPPPPPPPPQQQQQQQPEQASPQLSGGQSDVSRQPYLFVVAMPPPPAIPPGGYMPGSIDPSQPPMQPPFSAPYTSPV